ncbi:MAG TPA: DciA family protein [Acidobacteriaceae bacterium]|jgi:hypothetical protein|nr:DciA family protein [Acidobacteriaceae bacterium]
MEGMRELLRGSLARSLAGMGEQDRLAAAWTIACGRAMAERGVVSGYAEGVVRIEVSDSVWLRQMQALRGTLEREMARISGVKIQTIDFVIKRSRR